MMYINNFNVASGNHPIKYTSNFLYFLEVLIRYERGFFAYDLLI